MYDYIFRRLDERKKERKFNDPMKDDYEKPLKETIKPKVLENYM